MDESLRRSHEKDCDWPVGGGVVELYLCPLWGRDSESTARSSAPVDRVLLAAHCAGASVALHRANTDLKVSPSYAELWFNLTLHSSESPGE
ncbi:unnamed protein product [Lota lota]